MVKHTFNPRIQQISLEFRVSLMYRVSSKTTRATQSNPVLKTIKIIKIKIKIFRTKY